ncbi:MAG: hypothetical protein EOO68_37065 [Moraxellaceae bacterium]|nr:MAG: hypothetical protein EOO68_37065 [Moraxellaceae bacterium]
MEIYKLTNAQKILALTVLIAAVCASVLMVMQVPQLALRGPQLSTAESIPVSPHIHKVSTAKAEMPVMQSSLKTHQALSQNALQANAQTGHSKSWQMGDVKAATPKIPLSEKISDYAIVQIEQHPAQFPAIGDTMQLPMLSGQSLIANVQSTTINPNGDYTWSGHLQGYGDDYPVVMTYGEHSIFATITTPEGSYTMESVDGLGWLYKNPAEIELSNPGAKDFLDIREIH